MKVTDIPEFHDKSDVLCFKEEDTAEKAIQEMVRLNFGSAVITRGRKVVGIFTERDVMIKVVALGKDPKKLKIKDVMSKGVKVARKDDKVLHCLRRMSQGRFRHLPVVDESDNLIGILSQGDFMAFTWSQLFSQLKNQTKASFLSYTQLWMIALAIAVYILGIIIYVHNF